MLEENKNNSDNNQVDNNIEENKETNELNQVELLEAKLKESEDKYLRLLAEMENARRRFDKMQQDNAKYAITDFAKEMIVVLDIFAKATQSVANIEIKEEALKNFVIGIDLTQKELEKNLAKFGVAKIEAKGAKFDSNFHEALFAKEDKSKEDGLVFEVMEEGYKIHDRLLRSAKVGIIKN